METLNFCEKEDKMSETLKCEECGKAIDNYWGYLSDFYPKFFPERDRSKDQILYVAQDSNGLHYYCSEEHQNKVKTRTFNKGG